jgi:hypothetical protein
MMAELFNFKMMHEPSIEKYQEAVKATRYLQKPDNLLLSSIYIGIGQNYSDREENKEADAAFMNA